MRSFALLKIPIIHIATILCLAGWAKPASAARDTTHYTPAVVISVGAGYHFGLADLGKRFPSFSTLPASLYYKNSHNFIFGFEYNRFLGNRFKLDSLFGGIVGPSQQILDQNGFPAVIRYYMRGFTAQGYIGKSFKIFPKAKYARLQTNIGFGMMQHFLKMRFDKGTLPQLEGNYAAGYDMLTNGIMISQSLYYQYYNTKSVSFFGGFNFVQAFTQNRRNWNYGTMRQDLTHRKDFYVGMTAGILIPINLKPQNDKDYYD